MMLLSCSFSRYSNSGEEYFESGFSSSDNKDLFPTKEQELGNVESEEEEQISATNAAFVSVSGSFTPNKCCKMRGGKAAQKSRVQIQQAKDKIKFREETAVEAKWKGQPIHQ